MRRRLIRTGCLLLLAAVFNVAIAWACALWSPVSKRFAVAISNDHPGHLIERFDLGTVEAKVYVSQGLGWETRELHSSGPLTESVDLWIEMLSSWTDAGQSIPALPTMPAFVMSRTCGWPFESLYGEMIVLPYSAFDDVMSRPPADSERILFHYSILVPESWSEKGLEGLPYPLPSYPIIAGFAGNTLIYAVIAWLGLFLLSQARRVFRKRRGRCPACGYDMRGTPDGTCPECGAFGGESPSQTDSALPDGRG